MPPGALASGDLNVRARLRLAKQSPGLPRLEGYLEIWIKGTEFRVRDETGRAFRQILNDIAAPRGLGQAPRTIEEIMDMSSRIRNQAEWGAIEFSGNLATNRALIREAGRSPWETEAEEIVPGAGQIVTGSSEERLTPVKTLTLFGRACTEYQGFLEGEDLGFPYKSMITRIVSPPYIFINEVRDAANQDYYFIREVVDFDEGTVTNLEIEPQV